MNRLGIAPWAWFDDLPLRAKLVLPLGLILVGLALLTAIGVQTTLSNMQTRTWIGSVLHFHEASHDVFRDVVDMELGLRGYLSTGRTELLEPYERSRQTVREHFESLQQASAGEPEQAARWATLAENVAEWDVEVAQPQINVRRAVDAGLAAPSALEDAVGDPEVLARSEMIRQLFEEAEAQQHARVAGEHAQAVEQLARLRAVFGFAAFALFGIGLWVLSLQVTRIAHPMAALTAAAQRLEQGEFQARTALTPRKDEIGTLAGVFDRMAERVEGLVRDLSTSERRFRDMAEHASDMVFRYRLEPAPEFEYVSPSVAEILGYTPDEHYAQPGLARTLVHPDDLQLLEQALGSEDAAGPLVVRLRHRDGRTVWIEQRNTLVRDTAGRVVAVEGIARNVTARVEAEQRRLTLLRSEKLRALGQMASGIAHDLNQSLQIIVGYSQLARDAAKRLTPTNGQNRGQFNGYLALVEQAAVDAGTSVNRLLRFASGGPESVREAVDVTALLWEVLELTAPRWRDAAQAEGRMIHAEVQAPQEPLAVDGWAASLRDALTNLVFNAVDAMPNGGSIRLAAVALGSEQVAITVTDTGSGIPVDIQARLFEPFFSTKGERGTGLGLTQVQTAAERHGGSVHVESVPGEGSTFTLLLPRTPAARATAGPSGFSPLAANQAEHPGRRVLVVEDEPALARLVSHILDKYGYRALVVHTGEAALTLLDSEAVDVVLSDIGLGAGMDGWTVAAEVRRRYPSTPVVLATGWAAAVSQEEARARGVVAVLMKPYRMADLAEVLDGLFAPPPGIPAPEARLTSTR